jgi:hypothetical protein
MKRNAPTDRGLAARSAPAFISIRIAVGAVYQTLTLLLLQDRIPAVGVELGLIDHHRCTPFASGAMIP